MNSNSSDIDEDEPYDCIVIDNGSGHIKAGINDGGHGPSHMFPSVVCHRPRCPSVASFTMDTLVGHKAMSKKHTLALKNPIVRGIVADKFESWDDMEQIWSHVFKNELEVDPEDFNVLLTETTMAPSMKHHREKALLIMFERFEVPALYLANTAALSLYASCPRDTGLVIEVGAGVSQVVPVYEGYPLQHAIQKLDVSGNDLTNHLVHLLRKRYEAKCPYWLSSEAAHTNRSSRIQKETVRAIKEKFAFVANYDRYDSWLECSGDQFKEEYELPDGQMITIGAERFGCAEPLFKPSLISEEQKSISSDRAGIDQLAFTSIMHCDADIRRDLYENVVLCGGTTRLPDLHVRLTKELVSRAPADVKVKVMAPTFCHGDPEYSAFIGGCLLSTISIFEDMCISKDEYDEDGQSIVHRKCF